MKYNITVRNNAIHTGIFAARLNASCLFKSVNVNDNELTSTIVLEGADARKMRLVKNRKFFKDAKAEGAIAAVYFTEEE